MATKEKKAKPVRFKSVEGTVEGFISDGFSEITSIGEDADEAEGVDCPGMFG